MFLLAEDFLFGLHGLLGDLAEFLHELDTLDQAALGFVAELFEALTEVLKARVALVLVQALASAFSSRQGDQNSSGQRTKP